MGRKYDELKKLRAATEAHLNEASAKLQTYPKGQTGLTSDEVKQSQEWQRDRTAYNFWFTEYRKINAYIARHFKAELAEERRITRETRYK